jgi:photosystem II stability/assembly factor-like uncharacterized protein
MNHIIKLLSVLVLGGIHFTPQAAFSQSGSIDFQNEFLQRKVVRKSYAKTYKNAEKFLEKESKKSQRKNEIHKEITPLEWWKQEYLMTMDPSLGRPTPEALLPTLKQLNRKSVSLRATPGSSLYPWESRGPNDIAGRTRALCWDAADSKQLRVFAAGVTGGLWVNDDISNASSDWKQINGLWSNLNVSCIAQDPNDSKIIYIGTGEGFGTTASSSRGFGIFKTTDGGKSWTHLSNTAGLFYINDIAVRNESGSSVLYVATDILYYQGQWHGTNTDAGLLRSTDGGASFTNVSPFIPSQSQRYIASDIEIGPDNRLWVGTRKNMYSSASDQGGGRVLYSDNGTSFTESYKNSNALKGRVELACAPSSKDTLYAVIEANGVVQDVARSFNAGSTWSTFTEPSDADKGIPSTDFTRGQAWYDLIIAVNPKNAAELVIGGVNFFMSKESGNNWKQISKWSNNPGMDALSCSYIHADMHAAAYTNDGKRLIVGTDGGLFYAADVRNDPWNSNTAFVERNNRYVVTQYYAGSISQSNANFMLGGAQDNGTSYTQDTGFNKKYMLFGGDGGYCFIHPKIVDAVIFSYVKNNFYSYIDNQLYYLAQDNNTGSFINPAGLDFVNDNLFTQKGKGTLYRNDIYGSTSTLATINFASSVNDLASAFHVVERSSGKARLFLGTSLGNVFYSDNPEAATPTFTSLGSVNSGNISSIETLNGSLDTLFLTLTNYGVNNVYVSINGGTNWTAIDKNLPNMPVWDIVANPFNRKEAIIATELGMYQCLDVYNSDPTWTPIHNGMGAVKTMMLDYNKKEGVIMAATHGRGFFTSDAWVKTEPVAYFSLSDTVFCQGTTINLVDSSINNPSKRVWRTSSKDLVFTNNDSLSKTTKLECTKPGQFSITLEIQKDGITSRITKSIRVLQSYVNGIVLSSSNVNYCESDNIMLNASLADSSVLKLKSASLQWFKNGNQIVGNANKRSLNIPAPLVNNDQFSVQFTADYGCLSPLNASSNTFTINTAESTPLNITRSWDTLFSNYNGNGTVEWYRNNLKIGTGKRYTLISNGNFQARLIQGNCIGAFSNTIVHSSMNTQALGQYLQIGPNPNKGLLQIKSNLDAGLQLSIFDLKGRLVKSNMIIKAQLLNEIELDMVNGIYILVFKNDSGMEYQTKVSLNR